jgi:hypothetical protein
MRTEEEKKCDLSRRASDGGSAKVSKRERWFSYRTTWDCSVPRFLPYELNYQRSTTSKWRASSARDDERTLLRTLRQKEQFCKSNLDTTLQSEKEPLRTRGVAACWL